MEREQSVKDYGPKGVPLDPTFADHLAYCPTCREFNPLKPTTATRLCLEGSILWKRENIVAPKEIPAPINEFRVTKKEAEAAMRYKT